MLAFLSLLLLLAYAGDASSQVMKNIFILAGQSNMSGRGGVTNATWDGRVPGRSQPNSAVLRLSADLNWIEAHDPLHKDIDVNATCGVGPGMAFANSVLRKDPTLGVVGLVPCAVGGFKGTKISDWGRGTFLYNQTLTRANAPLKNGGVLQAILWYQGESDTVIEEDASKYRTRLRRFFTDIRSDLKAPRLLIIQVGLASGQGGYIEKVREAQFGVDLPQVRSVDAKGCQLKQDNLHLTTRGQVKLGAILAKSYLQTRHSPAVAP